MSAELPTRAELAVHRAKLEEHMVKGVAIAGGVALTSAVISEYLFRPAMAGAMVGIVESMRQFAQFHIEFYKFNKRFPGIDEARRKSRKQTNG